MGLAAFLLGVPSALSSGGVEFFQKIGFMTKMHIIFGVISLAVGALLICLFLGWVWGTRHAVKEVLAGKSKFKIRKLWIFSVKFLSPIAIIIILIFINKIISG